MSNLKKFGDTVFDIPIPENVHISIDVNDTKAGLALEALLRSVIAMEPKPLCNKCKKDPLLLTLWCDDDSGSDIHFDGYRLSCNIRFSCACCKKHTVVTVYPDFLKVRNIHVLTAQITEKLKNEMNKKLLT